LRLSVRVALSERYAAGGTLLRHSMIRLRIAAPLLLFIVAASAGADDLKTLAGKTVTGSLQSISDTVIVVGTTKTLVSQALEINFFAARPMPTADKYIEVQLADDSLVYCTKITFGAKESELVLTTGATAKVPTAAILTMVRDAQDSKVRDQWTKLMKTKKRSDRLFILNEGNLNPVDGSFGPIDDKTGTITFKPAIAGAKEVERKLDSVQGLQFARTEVAAQPNLCKIIDLDGNRLVASKVAYDAGKLTVTTPYGHKVAFDGKTLAKIDFNFGRLTYLSDLDARAPASVLFSGFNPVRRDKNLDGNDIMVMGKQYPKGLSMYAGAELEYDLGEKYKKLSAVLGVDARIAEEGQGKVTVTIYCDREKRFAQEVSTTTATPINLDVKDVKTLKIVVTGANFTNFSGHATLANAHVSQ
jgi:hypothetical protein